MGQKSLKNIHEKKAYRFLKILSIYKKQATAYAPRNNCL